MQAIKGWINFSFIYLHYPIYYDNIVYFYKGITLWQ